MPLRPRIPYDPSETTLGYAMRLSARHTGLPAIRFLSDLGVNNFQFYNGKEEAIRLFAERVDACPTELLHGSFARSRKHKTFRFESISKHFATNDAYRFCPTCLIEDGDPKNWKQRLEWCFRLMRSCPKHGTLIVDCPKGQQKDLRAIPRDFISRALRNRTQRDDDTPTYISWLQARLSDIPVNNWLDDCTIEQILGFSEVLGLARIHGIASRAELFNNAKCEAATEEGFAVVAGGEAAIIEALDEIYEANWKKAGQSGPRASYGILYNYFQGSAANDALGGPGRRILFNHVMERFAFGKGDVLFGKEVSRRVRHSLTSFLECANIPRKRAIKILKIGGLVRPESSQKEVATQVYPADEVEKLLHAYNGAIGRQEVSSYIGASVNMTRTMTARGIIKPILQPPGQRCHRRSVFSIESLDALLERLAELPILLDPDEDYVPLAYACQGKKWSTEEIIKGILDGSRPARRKAGRPRFMDLYTLRTSAMTRYLSEP